jgi:glycosyltransferase involved in cell wall biosynthesis
MPDWVECPPGRTGLGLIFRHGTCPLGFVMTPATAGSRFDTEMLLALAGPDVAEREIDRALRAGRQTPGAALPLPSLTVAICTKDRPERLRRLLDSLLPVIERSPFAATSVLVIDNASETDQTRQVCEAVARIDYVFEPKAGLDFARNAAIAHASGDLLAYLDDDVVVDPHWIEGLARAWRSRPDAGGFTGLVLPFRLDTDAQIAFEARGGFRRGFQRREFHADAFDNPLHPVGAGSIGAGANMAFDRALLIALGTFDEALDTGAPLPGGGDLDIFYRVLRSGRPMVYEPGYLVYHEHRETIAQLRRQYWSWGLGFMAFMTKAGRSDPALAQRQSAMKRWWLMDRLRAMLVALRQRQWQDLRFAAAEFRGGVQGYFGEYDRSRRRSADIRARAG